MLGPVSVVQVAAPGSYAIVEPFGVQPLSPPITYTMPFRRTAAHSWLGAGREGLEIHVSARGSYSSTVVSAAPLCPPIARILPSTTMQVCRRLGVGIGALVLHES